jgi:hypothetical protein
MDKLRRRPKQIGVSYMPVNADSMAPLAPAVEAPGGA